MPYLCLHRQQLLLRLPTTAIRPHRITRYHGAVLNLRHVSCHACSRMATARWLLPRKTCGQPTHDFHLPLSENHSLAVPVPSTSECSHCSQSTLATRVASWSESIVLLNHQSIEKEAEAVHLESSIRLSSGAGARLDVGAPRHDASAWEGLVCLACSLRPPFKRGQSGLPLILELSVLLLTDNRSGPYSVV
jgi:hypothetical protein